IVVPTAPSTSIPARAANPTSRIAPYAALRHTLGANTRQGSSCRVFLRPSCLTLVTAQQYWSPAVDSSRRAMRESVQTCYGDGVAARYSQELEPHCRDAPGVAPGRGLALCDRRRPGGVPAHHIAPQRQVD